MKKKILSQSEFASLYSERSFNPPEHISDFETEFDDVLMSIQELLETHFSPDEVHVYEYHNDSRFIEAVFETQAFLHATLIREVLEVLQGKPQDWMVCLSEACFLFITRESLLGFDPTNDTPNFKALFDS